ncbi:MAG: stage II sporulation protein M, partial [Chloroflexi bacterium]|nr:stage II sporulation protein M [Chloroflexota bacterium]
MTAEAVAPARPLTHVARPAGFSLRMTLIITQREVRETIADWRVVGPMLTLALIFPLLLVTGMQVGLPYLVQIDPVAAMDKVSLFGAMMAAFFPISFSLVIALESFVGEKERNTLEALLATPVSDGELFLGKLLAVMVPPVTLSNVALFVYVTGLWLGMGMTPPLSFILLTSALSLVEALAMVASAVVVSSHTASVKAANLLASFIIIPVALTVQAQVMLLLLGHGDVLWFFFLAFVAVAAMLMRMGIAVFNREEILTREGDQLSPRIVLATFLRFLQRTPATALHLSPPDEPPLSLRRLYGRDIPQLLRQNAVAAAVVAAVFIGSGLAGYGFALLHPLELQPVDLGEAVRQGSMLDSLSDFSMGGIFWHNLRVLTAAAILSIFSFGVIGLVLVLSAFLVLGFLAGEAAQMGIAPALFFGAFVAPHGLIEIPTVLLAGALNLRIGL